MNLIQAKYQQLAPKGDYLKDVIVLAQAWKKTHTAIRRHNGYADALGADCSSEVLRALKNSEMREFGEHRTHRLVLEAWDQLTGNGVSP